MATSTVRRTVLMAVLTILALKDIGNANWASQADETEDASHLSLDDNLFPENREESSGLEVDGPSERPSIFQRNTKDGVVTGAPSENPSIFGEETTSSIDKDTIDTPSESPTILGEVTTTIDTDPKDGRIVTGPPSENLSIFGEETTTAVEKDGLAIGTTSKSPTVFGEETTMAISTPSESPTTIVGDGFVTGIPSESHMFGDEIIDLGQEGEGSGLEETTLPPAVTELITEEDKEAKAQIGTTQATAGSTGPPSRTDGASESSDQKTVSETPSDEPTSTVVPIFHYTEQQTETPESTVTVVTERPSTTSATPLMQTSTLVPSVVPVTEPLTTKRTISTETSTTTTVTDQSTSAPETEARTIETSTIAIPTTRDETSARDETSTNVQQATTISPTADSGSLVSASDPCGRTFCKNGHMCVPTEDGKSAECICPFECPQAATPCCSVYMEEYKNVCEMHQQACGLSMNIALRNMGTCTDSESGSKYLPRIVTEEIAPSVKCSREEVVQFASRFQEWAMINKELADRTGPVEVNINSAIYQARFKGHSTSERRQILKYQFTAMDTNIDRLLDQREVEGFLRFVPSEHCLYGFMVSADVNRDGILSRDEWYEAFQFESEPRLGH